jgi:hydroxymethylpyrimidine pyrophosphatase-like HAD family hydrolase
MENMSNDKIYLFTDLDDTLIYTKRKTDFSRETLLGATNREGEVSSYIYKNVKDWLDKMVKSGMFEIVPTTARNLESYMRTLFYREYKFSNAILNFSGTILHNCEIDREWDEIVQKQYRDIPEISEVLNWTNTFFRKNLQKEMIPTIKSIDNLYISIYNKNFREEPEISAIVGKFVQSLLEERGLLDDFYIYKNDASFGILPKFLNKKFAVEYLIERDRPQFVMGAGDNISDWDFMNIGDFSIVPRGSNLNRKIWSE